MGGAYPYNKQYKKYNKTIITSDCIVSNTILILLATELASYKGACKIH